MCRENVENVLSGTKAGFKATPNLVFNQKAERSTMNRQKSRRIVENVLSGTKAGFKAILNLVFNQKAERSTMNRQKSRRIVENVLSGTKAGFKSILNLEHPFERKKMFNQKSSSTFSATLLALTLMVAAFWVGSAAVTAKEMVKDPSTGKMVSAPEHGGTLTAILFKYPVDHGSTFLYHGAGLVAGPTLDKLGIADWALDRSLSKFTTYFPESIIRGHLAESWENPDPLTYIFKIRDNVSFHDKPPVSGRQLTADDMAANYQRLFGIGRFAGQEPVGGHGWGTSQIPVESVTATDELTFVVKLSRPHADTHRQLLDDCHIRAYPPETFDMIDDANNVIGTGPFLMDEFVSGTSVTFDRNPNYWKDDEKYPGNRLPYVDRLVMLMMGDEQTRIAALRSAQVDFTGDNGVARIKSISSVLDLQKTNPGMQFFEIAFRCETCLGFKNHEPPLSDVRVRHALQMAIDLKTIRDSYFSGFGEWKPMGPIGPQWIGYHNAFDTWPEEVKKFWSYDPEGAERLLDEAGYPRGADGVRFRTSIMTQGERGDVGYMELVAGYWKKIGVAVKIETTDNATWVGRRSAGDFDGLLDNWSAGADYATLDSSLGAFRAGTSFSGGAFNYPVFNTRWEELHAASGDEDEYRRLAKALDMYAIEQHVYLWGPRVPSFAVVQPWIVGYNGENQLGNCHWTQPYARIWIDSQLKDEMN